MSEPIHIENLIPPEALPTRRLLEAIAGHDRICDVATSLSLRSLADKTIDELRDEGVPPGAAKRVACAFELSRRVGVARCEPLGQLRSSREIFDHLHPRLRDLPVEQFLGIYVNGKNRVIRELMISQGILTASLVHPREVFAPAIRLRAAGIILAHNHPSGDPEPSAEDIEVTRRLSAVGELVGIRILDHVVIGDGRYVSFLERGMIEP